jgi:competence protein ComEC
LELQQDHYILQYQIDGLNQLEITITDRLRSTPTYHRYYADVIAVNDKKTSGKLLIRMQKEDAHKLDLGFTLKTADLLNPIHASKNIGSFNYKSYLLSIGVRHQLELTDFVELKRKVFSLMTWLRGLKQQKLDAIEFSSFKEETKQLVMALILGERSELDRAWMDRYAQAGIVHILAISGLHMGLLMVLLGWIYIPLRLLPQGNYLQVFMIILSLWCYALLTGASASVIRAATMFSLFSIGTYLKRSPPTLYLLLLSFGILVYSNPLYIKQLGFQMSYLAVFGILILQPILLKILSIKNKLLHRFWVMTTVTLAAQIAVSPLAIYHFHQFPGLFLITNWMVLPFVALYLYLGIGSLILLHWQLLPTFLIDLLNLMTASLNNFVRWVVNQKAFFFEELRLSMYDVILIYALLLFLYFDYIKMKKRILLGLFLGIMLLQWFAHQAREAQERTTAVWLMPAYNNTVLFYKNKKTLRIFCTQEISESNRLVKEFQNEFRIDRIQIEELKNTYVIEGKTLFFIDCLWAENFDFKKQRNLLVLTKNTRVNLEAMLLQNQIDQIIVDGSSYPSVKTRWKKTCAQYNIPFYDLQQDGPYLLSSKTRDIGF